MSGTELSFSGLTAPLKMQEAFVKAQDYALETGESVKFSLIIMLRGSVATRDMP